MKRFFSLCLILVLLIGLVPLQARAAQGGKLVALTFDDGPDSTDTVTLLDGLKERNVHVTFFTLGENASRSKEIVRRAYAEGHEIACHSWDHPDLRDLSDSEIRSQISRSTAVLDEICGTGARYLFRPPYGATNEHIRTLINHPLILWSVDPEDWKYRNSDTVRDSIVKDTYDGAIVLAHDIHATTIPGALQAIDILQSQGYEFVTVSELFRRRGEALENGKQYYDRKNNGTDSGPIAAPEITYTTDGTTMEITLTAAGNAPVYYTTDGSVPNEQAKRYEGPFTVNYPCNIHAVAAYRLNGSRSDLAVLAPGQTPSKRPTIRIENMVMTLQTETPDAGIYYTTDGSDPTVSGIRYEGPVEITGGYEIRAVAGGGFYRMSPELRLYCSQRGQLYRDMTPADWYFEPIDRLTAQGLMAGVGDYRAAPKMQLTRGMLVTLLYQYSGEALEEGWSKTSAFTDVPADQYYAAPVEWAYRGGIVSGYSATSFRPNANVTRQELCKIVDRFLANRGHALPAGESCEGTFADYGQIQPWAVSSVEAMVSAGLLSGDGTNVNPRGNATRGEAAAILCRMMDYEASFAR